MKDNVRPTDTLLVVDSMTGQEAAKVFFAVFLYKQKFKGSLVVYSISHRHRHHHHYHFIIIVIAIIHYHYLGCKGILGCRGSHRSDSHQGQETNDCVRDDVT